jgi:hypothetical protein
MDADLREFYGKLLDALHEKNLRGGQWQLCERLGWPDNDSHLNIVAWCTTSARVGHLIAVNLSDRRSQARIRLPASTLDKDVLHMTDHFTGTLYERRSADIREAGLYVDLEPWAFHLLKS